MTCGIYLITNKKNNKKYVGQSISIERRWKQHIDHALNYRGKDYYSPLYTDIRINGVENFKFDILQKTSENKNVLNESEQFWINKLGTLKNGYNIIPSNNSKRYSHKSVTIEDIRTKETINFSSLKKLLEYLQKCGYTSATNLDGYFNRCIKRKIPIFNKWYLYYRKEY